MCKNEDIMVVLMFVNPTIQGSDTFQFHYFIFSKGSQWDQMVWELVSPLSCYCAYHFSYLWISQSEGDRFCT